MKIWLTGANGLLGASVRHILQTKNIPFIATTRSEVDICNEAALIYFYQQFGPFTHLINAAAYTKVDLAESNRDEAFLVNAESPGLMGKLAVHYGFHVVHLSTDYVFDGAASRPYREDDPIRPQTVYGQTKAEGERRLLAAYPDACIIRTSWLFGPGGKNFVSTMADLMKKKEVLQVVSDQRGRPTYTPDLAEVLIEALHWSGIYHVANHGETSWHAFAEEILTRMEQPRCKRIEPITTACFGAAAVRPLYSVLDTIKAERKMGREFCCWKKGLNQVL